MSGGRGGEELADQAQQPSGSVGGVCWVLRRETVILHRFGVLLQKILVVVLVLVSGQQTVDGGEWRKKRISLGCRK